jgi:hypothetical protein
LNAISCPSVTACAAVGSYGPASRPEGLTALWNGKTWAMSELRGTRPTYAPHLTDVSCPSPTACMAVGFYANAAGDLLLAYRWNGAVWTSESVSTPRNSHDPYANSLNGVACSSATTCTAVGGGGPTGTLVARWNGANWMLGTAPNPTGPLAFLGPIACATTSACTSIGIHTTNSGSSTTFADRWNGYAWSVQSTANPSTHTNLSGVACPTAGACTAVGQALTRTSPLGAALAERWTGTSWIVEPTPNP